MVDQPIFRCCVDRTRKIVAVQKNQSAVLGRYSTAQVNPCLQPDEASASFFKNLNYAFLPYSWDSYSCSDMCTPFEKLITPFNKNLITIERRFSLPSEIEDAPQSIQVIEVIEKDDLRATGPEMRDAFMAEVLGILERRTFKVMLKEQLPDGAKH